MARQQLAQAKVWSRLVLARKEPLITTHATARLSPGMYAVIKTFKLVSRAMVIGHVWQDLNVHMRDCSRRRGFSRTQGVIVDGILDKIVPDLVTEALLPLEHKDKPGHYVIPYGDTWDGVSSRVHTGVPFFPIAVVLLEENPADRLKPMPTSVHVMFPLKPSVVLAGSELLSCSFGPGEHRVLMHAPGADTLGADDVVTSNIILMSRVSAMADFAITPATSLNSEVLRHGADMRRLRERVAGRGGRWVMRHVHMARDGAAAPAQTHPSGSMDGLGDVVLEDEI